MFMSKETASPPNNSPSPPQVKIRMLIQIL